MKLLHGYGRGCLLRNDVLYVPSLLVGHSCESTGECGMVKYKIQARKRLVSLHIIYLYNVTLVVHLSCYINACPAKACFSVFQRVSACRASRNILNGRVVRECTPQRNLRGPHRGNDAHWPKYTTRYRRRGIHTMPRRHTWVVSLCRKTLHRGRRVS